MPHPFFEPRPYPMHRPDARVFFDALVDSIIKPADIQLVYGSCGAGLPPLALNEAPHLIWKAALDALAVAGLIQELGKRLEKRNLPAVHKAFEVITAATDPLKEESLSPGVVFLDRKNLRSKLDLLAGTGPVAVLVVRGEARSGKSWTKHILENHANTTGEGCIYLSDGIVGTIREVLDLIFAALGGTVPPKDTTEDAWFKAVCIAMTGLASKPGFRRTWIIADDLGVGVNGPRIDPLIKQFFDQVALFMQTPAFGRHFRVVLIDYPDGVLPTRWRAHAVEDRTARTDLCTKTISEFLAGWAKGKGKVLTDEHAQRFADDIATKADGTQTEARLEFIHEELLSVMGKL